MQSEQEEAPSLFLVLLQEGRDNCLLSPCNHWIVQLPLQGFGCLCLKRKQRPFARALQTGPRLGFALAPPAQEQPCAVAIGLEDMVLLTVPEERNVWGVWWQHIYDVKLYWGPEGELPKLINKWTKIKFRKEHSSTDERGCQPDFIHFGLGDSRRHRIQWHSNLILQVKGHKMGSNLFFMGHHFLAFFFFFFFWQETTGNLYRYHQRLLLLSQMWLCIWLKELQWVTSEMLSLHPQGRISKQQLCWQGYLPCYPAALVPSDSGNMWAVTPQTSNERGEFLEYAYQEKQPMVWHTVGCATAGTTEMWEEGSDQSYWHVAVSCLHSRQQPYWTSQRKLAALAGRKQLSCHSFHSELAMSWPGINCF